MTFLSTRFVFLAVALAATAPIFGQGGEWIELFNGEDLSGWRVSENRDSVYVEDGALVTHGPRAHAFYVGDGDASFKNFQFTARVWTEPVANSGIYFHSRYVEQGWPDRGYEVQVNNSHRDPKRTGGLYNVQDNFEAPVGERRVVRMRDPGRGQSHRGQDQRHDHLRLPRARRSRPPGSTALLGALRAASTRPRQQSEVPRPEGAATPRLAGVEQARQIE